MPNVSIMRRACGVPNTIDRRSTKLKRVNGKVVIPKQVDHNSVLFKNTQKSWYNVFVGTPCTGLVRIEWALARFNLMAPCNYGQTSMICPIPSFAPMGYLVADAQNVIIGEFLKQSCEWLLLLEEDNVVPQTLIMSLDKHIRKARTPVISALYFTKSIPAEPMIYRGRSVGYYDKWKIGDEVWCDGVPTGMVLIHRSLLEVMWKDSPEYMAGNAGTRKIFNTPSFVAHDPEKGYQLQTGTSDLDWCSRVITGGFLAKAGWKKTAKKPYPFLVDTNILCMHINHDGMQFPSHGEIAYWSKPYNKR